MARLVPSCRGLWLALPLALGCAPDAAVVTVEGKTEHGLLEKAKATDTARIGVVRGVPTSVFFSNDFIPRTSSSIPMSGQVWVARNSVKVTFIDGDGKEQAILAAPGIPGKWSGSVRLRRPKDGNNGFQVQIVPITGTPAEADGIVLEVVYTEG